MDLSSTKTVSVVMVDGKTREIEYTDIQSAPGFIVFISRKGETHLNLSRIESMDFDMLEKARINLITN